MPEKLRPSGWHRRTASFQTATIVYDATDPTDRIPPCPHCGQPMVLRTAKTGKNIGKQFWGCSDYPDCKGVLKL